MSAFDNQVSVGLLVNPTLTGGAVATLSAGNAYAYVCNNVIVTKVSGALTALSGATMAAGTTSTFTFYGDAAGTITVVKGNTVTGTASGVVAISDIAPQGTTGLSTVNPTLAVIGVLIVVNATNPFIPGTTLLNAAGVTTYISNFPVSGF